MPTHCSCNEYGAGPCPRHERQHELEREIGTWKDLYAKEKNDHAYMREECERLKASLHTACGSCGTPTEPDIRICPKCLDAWIGGNGCEFLDKINAPIRERCLELEAQVERLRKALRDAIHLAEGGLNELGRAEASRLDDILEAEGGYEGGG